MKNATIKAVSSIVGGLVLFTVIFFIFQSSPSTSEATMTSSEAQKIASEQFQGEVVSLELDDGRYEIEIENEESYYELELDAKTGDVLKLEEKNNRKKVAKQPEQSPVADKEQVDKIKEEANPEKEIVSKEEDVKQAEKSDSNENAISTNKNNEKSKGNKEGNKEENKVANVMISNEAAIKIARKEVPNATIIKMELDSDDGRRFYEIEMHTDNQEVEIEIDAYTGEIIMYQFEELEGHRKGLADIITIEEAKKIALEKSPDATIKEIQLDRDDGRYYYEIEMKSSKYEIDLEIDAHTGKIIEIDYDDRD